jgi:transcriptional regulator with XRE-family HTH domain
VYALWMADDSSLRAIGSRIEALRLALGYTNATAFARRIGITQTRLANYEAGFRRPNIDAALSIVRETGASLDYIYRGDRSLLPHHLAIALGEPHLKRRAS